MKRINLFVVLLLISPISISTVATSEETEFNSNIQYTNRTILNENGSISYYFGDELIGFTKEPIPIKKQDNTAVKFETKPTENFSGYTLLNNSYNDSIPKFVEKISNHAVSSNGNTNGFVPNRGAINKTVFEDRVEDLNLEDYSVIDSGFGGMGTADSGGSKYIWLETYPSGSGGVGKAYAMTYPIDYNNSINSNQGPISYIIGTEFKLLSTSNYWPYVLYNGQVNIFIHQDDDLDVWYSSTHHLIKENLNVGTWYHLYCIVYPQLQQYDIYLVNLETNEVVAGPITALFSSTTNRAAAVLAGFKRLLGLPLGTAAEALRVGRLRQRRLKRRRRGGDNLGHQLGGRHGQSPPFGGSERVEALTGGSGTTPAALLAAVSDFFWDTSA